MILDALQHSAVLVQAFPNDNLDQKKEDQAGISNNGNVATIPFPLSGMTLTIFKTYIWSYYFVACVNAVYTQYDLLE